MTRFSDTPIFWEVLQDLAPLIPSGVRMMIVAGPPALPAPEALAGRTAIVATSPVGVPATIPEPRPKARKRPARKSAIKAAAKRLDQEGK